MYSWCTVSVLIYKMYMYVGVFVSQALEIVFCNLVRVLALTTINLCRNEQLHNHRWPTNESKKTTNYIHNATPFYCCTTLAQRRLVTLLHARCCTNRAIHGRFNPVQPAESADHNLRTSTTIPTDVIRNVPSINTSITWPTSSDIS